VYFDVNQSVLSGVPVATLQLWLQQAQQAYANYMIGGNPINLSYTQGDGTKSVTRNMTSPGQLQNWIMLLQRALGINHGARRPIRPLF